MVVEHPFNHRPGHHRKARNKVDRAITEAGNFVVWIGNDLRTHWKHAHVEPVHVVRVAGNINRTLLFGDFLHTLGDQSCCLRVQYQLDAQGLGRALARVIVGCGTDAAGGENHVTGCKSTLQGGRDALWRVAYVLGIVELQATRLEQFNHLGQMLVGTLARKDFIADDDQAETGRCVSGNCWNWRKMLHPSMLALSHQLSAAPGYGPSPPTPMPRRARPATLPDNNVQTTAKT